MGTIGQKPTKAGDLVMSKSISAALDKADTASESVSIIVGFLTGVLNTVGYVLTAKVLANELQETLQAMEEVMSGYAEMTDKLNQLEQMAKVINKDS